MRAILDDPVMHQALLIMSDGMPPVDAPIAAPEITSVRILSQMAGAHAAFMLLHSLAEPLEPEPEPMEPTWEKPAEPPEL